jgi:hypothetical protein
LEYFWIGSTLYLCRCLSVDEGRNDGECSLSFQMLLEGGGGYAMDEEYSPLVQMLWSE